MLACLVVPLGCLLYVTIPGEVQFFLYLRKVLCYLFPLQYIHSSASDGPSQILLRRPGGAGLVFQNLCEVAPLPRYPYTDYFLPRISPSISSTKTTCQTESYRRKTKTRAYPVTEGRPRRAYLRSPTGRRGWPVKFSAYFRLAVSPMTGSLSKTPE